MARSSRPATDSIADPEASAIRERKHCVALFALLALTAGRRRRKVPGDEAAVTVGLKIGSVIAEVGSGAFFHSFFSTVAVNLEPAGWGTRFPIIMNRLYAGEVCQAEAKAALAELTMIGDGLSKLPVDRVVWDFDDRSQKPPWGNNIADTITDLSNYHVTSTGRDLMKLIGELLEYLRDEGGVLTVVSY